jgi:hypothetical protein
MPLTAEVNKILFEDSDPKESISRLLKRRLKSELWLAGCLLTLGEFQAVFFLLYLSLILFKIG